MAKPVRKVKQSGFPINTRMIVIAAVAVLLLVGGAVLYATGMLTGSKAAAHACQKTTENGVCVYKCRVDGEDVTLPCPNGNAAATGRGGSNEKEPRKNCHKEDFDCNCKTMPNGLEHCQTCSHTVCDN